MIDIKDFKEDVHEIVVADDLKKLLEINGELQEDLVTLIQFLKPLVQMFPAGEFSMMKLMPAVNGLLKDKSFSENLNIAVKIVEKYNLEESNGE